MTRGKRENFFFTEKEVFPLSPHPSHLFKKNGILYFCFLMRWTTIAFSYFDKKSRSVAGQSGLVVFRDVQLFHL